MANKQYNEKILMYMDSPICLCSFLPDGSLYECLEIYDIAHMPVGYIGIEWLRDWWRNNAIPAYRDSIKKGLRNIGLDSEDEFKLLCRGLSLTNHYWLKDSDETVSWQDVCFWKNGITDEIGEALFNHKPFHSKFVFGMYSSPEASVNGQFQKRWIYKEGKFYLLKKGSNYDNQEAFNEVLASKLFELCHVPHVSYYTEIFNGEIVSVCGCMTDEAHELIPCIQLLDSVTQQYGESEIDYFFRVLDMYSVAYDRKTINDMLAIDYLIANEDRHYNNIGIIRGSSTGKMTLAPVFDSGTSMWSTKSTIGMDFLDDAAITAKPFCRGHGTWEQQRNLITTYPDVCADTLIDVVNDYAVSLAKYTQISVKRIIATSIAVLKRSNQLITVLRVNGHLVDSAYEVSEEQMQSLQEHLKNILE